MKFLGRGGLVTALFALLVLLVYSDPLFVQRNFAGRDLLGYHLPVEKAIHDAYARGRLPTWIPEVSGGRPLAANPNAGALYPVRWALSVVPFPWAMRVFALLHWILAGVGVILFLRSLRLSLPAAWLGAVTYVFSGVSVTEVFYTNNHPGVALLPWIAWAMAQSEWPRQKRIFALSLLLGLDFLAGDVFTAAIALLACGLWIVSGEGRAREESLVLAVSLGLALLIALPQLAATALWIPHTERAVSGFRVGEAVELSLSPWRLMELLIPFPFGETWRLDPNDVWAIPVLSGRPAGFFSTLYAGAIAPIAVVSVWGSRRREARFSRALLLGGIVLAVSGSLVPAAVKGWRSPLPFRHPEKFAVLLALGLAMFAAMGWDRLRLGDPAPRWSLAVGIALAAIAVWARLDPSAIARLAVFVTRSGSQAVSAAAERLGPALAEGALLWLATVLAWDVGARKSSAAVAAALVLLTAIPIGANRRIAGTYSQDAVFAPTRLARLFRKADPDGSFRTLAIPASAAPGAAWAGQDAGGLEFWRRSWLYFTPALWDRGEVFNQDADHGDLSRMASLRRLATLAAGFTDAQAFFGSLALRWNVRFRDEPTRAGYHQVGVDAIQSWDEHESPDPDIRLASRWREESAALGALERLPRLRQGEIVVESGVTRQGSGPGGLVRVLERTPERLILETQTDEPSWLFVLRGYFPYRRVLTDGRPSEVVPAQLAFSAVAVPNGRHRIDWAERLPGSPFSFGGPIAFLVLAGVAFGRGSREDCR